jgi:homocysteine S-methyltransferase
MSSGYEIIDAKLAAGDVVVLDGGIGTELQRQGATMSGEVWCALASRSHSDIVRKVHDSYIAAGAEVITANTFASSPLMLQAHGLEAEMEGLDALALKVAFEARADATAPVCVAASMSAMRPIEPGTDQPDPAWSRPENECRDIFRRKADILAEAGAELIIMEMMRDTDYALWACEAARETELPVWLGLSCRHRESDNALVGYNRDDCLFTDIIDVLKETGPRAVAIMHSSLEDTEAALPVLRDRWQGPVGIYPESGYFTIPDWVFGDIEADDFGDVAMNWVHDGVSIVGGCCGISPEHIKAFSNRLRADAHV